MDKFYVMSLEKDDTEEEHAQEILNLGNAGYTHVYKIEDDVFLVFSKGESNEDEIDKAIDSWYKEMQDNE